MSDELAELEKRLEKLRRESMIAIEELERYQGLVEHYTDVCNINNFEIQRVRDKIDTLKKGDQGAN